MAIEQTARRWKLLILFGTSAALAGVAWMVTLTLAGRETGWQRPVGLMVGGIFVRCVGSMGKWFFHE